MKATAKFGETIETGDTVIVYYGGDQHVATVDEISEQHGVTHVTVSVTTRIPAGAATLVNRVEKKAHKTSSRTDAPTRQPNRSEKGTQP